MKSFEEYCQLIESRKIIIQDMKQAEIELEFTLTQCENVMHDPEVQDFDKMEYRAKYKRATKCLNILKEWK